jgi:hypothetical protein
MIIPPSSGLDAIAEQGAGFDKECISGSGNA